MRPYGSGTALSARCAALFASYYALLYPAAMMFSTYMVLLGYDRSLIAVLMSVSGVVSLLSRPLIGTLSDRGLCRKTAVVLILMMAAGTAVFFLLPDRTVYHAAAYVVMCSTACGCSMDLIDSWAVKLVKQTGSVDYGKTRAFGSGSFALTSLIFGWLLAEFGIGLAPWAIFLLLSLFLISVLSVPEPKTEMPGQNRAGIAKAKELLNDRKYLIFIIFYAMANATFMFTDTYIPVLILERGGNTAQTGLNDCIMAAIEFMFLRHFTQVADRLGTERVVWLGMLGFCVKACLTAAMPTPALIILACTTQIISFCFFMPSRMRFLEKNVEHRDLGTALSVSSLASSLFSTVVANPAASRIIPVFGTGKTMMMFGLLSAFCGIGFALSLKTVDKKMKKGV